MTDIVERLRSENTLTGYYDPPRLQADAADEIERLRAALRLIVETTNPDNAATPTTLLAGCAVIAKKALDHD